MNRRKFIHNSTLLGLFPLLSRGLPISSLAATTPFNLNPCDVTDRSVVVIFLNGANDIINTAVPISQFSDYVNFRPSIHLPEDSLITLDPNLDDNQALGLHPRLTGFKNLYDDGLLTMVQGVGYDQPNRSHFKSTENWLTGSGGSLQNQKDGWFARFLNDRYPDYSGIPFIGEPDPLGLLFGNTISTGFHTTEEHRLEINLSGQDPSGFYTLISSLGGAPLPNIPATEHGDMLAYLETISNSVNVYAQRISETFNNGINTADYPSTSFGNQLKTIARMLAGGSRTKFFMTNKGGWDNHNLINTPGMTTEGRHADLLGDLGDSVQAFQNDLQAMGLENKVLTVIFSEFGRKIIENGSQGTDHGTLSTMFLVGQGVEGGVVGNNINLSDQDNPGAPNPSQIQHDYREVFSTVLQDWLGANDSSLQNTFVQDEYYNNRPNLINTNNLVPESCYYTPEVLVTCACIQVKLFLEGFYQEDSNTMHTKLADNSLLPTTQPYGVNPFLYSGTESVDQFPENTVDWLLIELRQADNIDQVAARKAVLLRKDGLVMDPSGTLGVSFENVPDGSYHIAVYHRNHLAVLSASPIVTNAPSFIYDFTISKDRAAGENQLKQVGNNWVLIAGDTDQNQLVNNQDYNLWQQQQSQTPGYQPVDLNADGITDSADLELWFDNRSKLGQLK